MATPIVNITPRSLPRDVSPDRMGLAISAADLLMEDELRRRKAAAAAEQAGLDRDLQRELLETRGGQAIEQIDARGEVQSGLQQQDAELFRDVRIPSMIERDRAGAAAQGEQRRLTAGEDARLQAEVVIPARTEGESRLIDERGAQDRTTLDRRFENQGALDANELILREQLQGDRLDRELDIAEMRAQNSGFGGFGGFGGGGGIDLDRLEVSGMETDRGRGGQAGAGAPGLTRGGEASGGPSRTPPREGGGGLGGAFRSLMQTERPAGLNLQDAGLGAAGRGPDMDFDPELSALPMEAHVSQIQLLQDQMGPDAVREYLLELSPDVRTRLQALMRR